MATCPKHAPDGSEIDIPAGAPVHEASVDFFPKRLSLLAVTRSTSPATEFLVANDQQIVPGILLTGDNEGIYRLAEGMGMLQDPLQLADYLRFFFFMVHASMGNFFIVESPEQIPWKEGVDPLLRDMVDNLVIPLTFLGKDRGGVLQFTGTVIFRDGLFKTNILLATQSVSDYTQGDDEPRLDLPVGGTALRSETLLMEDLPILPTPNAFATQNRA